MVRQILTLVACLSALAIGTAKAKAADVPVDPPAGAVQATVDQATGTVTPVVADAAAADVPEAVDTAGPIVDSSTATDDEEAPEADAPSPPSQDGEASEPAPEPATPDDGDEPDAGSPAAEEPEPAAPPTDEGDNTAEANSQNTSESTSGTQVQQGAGQTAPAAEQPGTPPSPQPAVTPPSPQPAVTPPPAAETTPAAETPPAPATSPGTVSQGGEPAATTPPPATGTSEPAESPASTPPAGSRHTGARSCGRAANRTGTPRRHPETGRTPHRRPSVNRSATSQLAVAHPAAPRPAAPRPPVDGQAQRPVTRPQSSASPEPKAKPATRRGTTPKPHPRLRVDETGSRVAQAPADTSSATGETWLLLAAMLLGALGISGLAYAGLPNRRDVVPLAGLSSRLRSKGLSDSRVAWHAVRRLRPTKGGNHDGIRYRE